MNMHTDTQNQTKMNKKPSKPSKIHLLSFSLRTPKNARNIDFFSKSCRDTHRNKFCIHMLKCSVILFFDLHNGVDFSGHDTLGLLCPQY